MRKIIKDYIRESLPTNYFANNAPSKILPNLILVWDFVPEQVGRKKNCTQKSFGICPNLHSAAANYFIYVYGGDMDNLIKKHNKKKIRKLKKFEKSDVDTIIEEAKAISNDIDLIYKRHLNALRIEKISTDF